MGTEQFSRVEPVPAISIIIPMYNVEKYVGQCLDSVLAQTFKDYEVVLVNDCSTDNSLAIAESYIARFEHESGRGVTHSYSRA